MAVLWLQQSYICQNATCSWFITSFHPTPSTCYAGCTTKNQLVLYVNMIGFKFRHMTTLSLNTWSGLVFHVPHYIFFFKLSGTANWCSLQPMQWGWKATTSSAIKRASGAKKQRMCIASSADSIAMGAMAIPAPFAKLGLFTGIPTEGQGRVVVSYGWSTLTPACHLWLTARLDSVFTPHFCQYCNYDYFVTVGNVSH